MAAAMKPAYLLSGDDDAKLSAALARLRGRAEREGGPGALEVFEAAGATGPDADALAGSMPALSLTAERRYLLADGVERWKAAQVESLVAALAAMPAGRDRRAVARGAAAQGAGRGGRGRGRRVPRLRGAAASASCPPGSSAAARERGFDLAPQAARALVARLGESTVRLGTELDRLALWAGERGGVGVEDVEEMIGDTSERAGWALGDAIVAPRPRGRGRHRRRPARPGRGRHPAGLRDGLAAAQRPSRRARRSRRGTPPREVEAALPMAPYPAKMLVRSVRGVDPASCRRRSAAIADLEWWTRGGSDYCDEVALTLAVRRAAGG